MVIFVIDGLSQFTRRILMSSTETFTPYVRSSIDRCCTHSRAQANVLIDSSGNPCLTDFGLATVVGNAELQWTTTTAEVNFNSRWRAPEVIGVDCELGRPSFKSGIYSFGNILLFVRPLSSVCSFTLNFLHSDRLGVYSVEG